MYPAHVRSIFTTIAILFGFQQIPKVLIVLNSHAPSALFEPLKQRQHNDSQPTVILCDQALCGERAICSNPEQLFAAGWSACFISAMGVVANKMKVKLPDDAAVDAEIDLCNSGDVYFLRARLNVSLPGCPLAKPIPGGICKNEIGRCCAEGDWTAVALMRAMAQGLFKARVFPGAK